MAKVIRIIFFFPIHLILGLVLRLRHWLYDAGLISSVAFPVPVICIGNLELGGSGKTPMADYLLERLARKRKTAFLSRGYGRKSSGFLWLNHASGPEEAGDEPWMLFKKWGATASFAVDADRVAGISRILKEKPETELILLDDAFQHRRVRPSFNLLLTPFQRPYFRNFLFPAGSLRDVDTAAGRADLLVVTKAPDANEEFHAKAMAAAGAFLSPGQQLFVSTLSYGQPRNGRGDLPGQGEQFIAMAGLADNEPFFQYCSRKFNVKDRISLPDHFHYSTGFFKKMNPDPATPVICTEKDFAKILAVFPFPDKVFYLPIQIRIFPEDTFLHCIEKSLSV